MGEDRMVIRGGYVITMDQSIGDLPVGAVRRGRRIVEAASSLDASDAIDARGGGHFRDSSIRIGTCGQTRMRAICADWTLGDSFQVRFAAAVGIKPIAPSS
jgi:hypothetical protein